MSAKLVEIPPVDPLVALIEDMKSVEGEYLRRYSLELTNLVSEVMENIKGNNPKPIIYLIHEYAKKMNDINNADFEENTNPHHGQEQGGQS